MPKDNKKRGRRGEAQKRKRDDAVDIDRYHQSPKRRRASDAGITENTADTVPLGAEEEELTTQNADGAPSRQPERPFYGLLDDDEQEYFKKADDMLEVNQFKDAEERALFIENVHKEASGKELKLACSQSCSRLLERLMLLSTSQQLNGMFQKFKGQFLNLVQHRFASHCCETLFVQAAPAVTEELVSGSSVHQAQHSDSFSISMEHCFLDVITELEGNIGYLMTDKFASHTLRLLLVVLSGQALDTNTQKSLLQSKKKEHVDVLHASKPVEHTLQSRTVPDAFLQALEKMISDSVIGLDTTYVRALATHPTANPMLQLLVQIELSRFGRQRAKDEDSLIRKLLPDDPLVDGSESSAFVNGLIYDPIGSRLLEAIVDHAPGKMFKALFRELFKNRMGSLARNEVAGYVVCHILNRLGAEDLQAALEAIRPQIPNLAERGRTNVMKTLAERCAIRKVDTTSLAHALQAAYPGEFRRISVMDMLQLEEPSIDGQTTTNGHTTTRSQQPPTQSESQSWKTTTPQQNAASSLLQTLLRIPGPLSQLVFDALARLSRPITHQLAITPALSPILQIAVTTPCASLIFRRKIITGLYGTVADLATSSAGSRLIDAVEVGSRDGLAFVRERVAEELAESEELLRNSTTGRKVWKNWRMDLYKRHRGEWVHTTRQEVGNDGFQSFPGILGECDVAAKEKGRDVHGRVMSALGEVSKEVRREAKAVVGQFNGAVDSMSKIAVNGSKRSSPAQKPTGDKSALQLAREKYAKASHEEKNRQSLAQAKARKLSENTDWAKVVGMER